MKKLNKLGCVHNKVSFEQSFELFVRGRGYKTFYILILRMFEMSVYPFPA